MSLRKTSLDRGRTFLYENTTPGELQVSITTVAGSRIEFRLPPGGQIRVDRVFEYLKVEAHPATGVAPVDTPKPEAET